MSEVHFFYFLLIKAEGPHLFSPSWYHLCSVLLITGHSCHWQGTPAASSAPPPPNFHWAQLPLCSNCCLVQQHCCHTWCPCLSNTASTVQSAKCQSLRELWRRRKKCLSTGPSVGEYGAMLLVPKQLSECILIIPFFLIFFSYKQPILLTPQGLRDLYQKTKQTSR